MSPGTRGLPSHILTELPLCHGNCRPLHICAVQQNLHSNQLDLSVDRGTAIYCPSSEWLELQEYSITETQIQTLDLQSEDRVRTKLSLLMDFLFPSA